MCWSNSTEWFSDLKRDRCLEVLYLLSRDQVAQDPGGRRAAKPANEVITDFGAEKAATAVKELAEASQDVNDSVPRIRQRLPSAKVCVCTELSAP